MRSPINLSQDLLRNCINLEIKKCFRSFYTDDYKTIPNEEMFLKSDGVIILLLSDESLLGFYPKTEEFTVLVELLKSDELSNEVIDISEDAYWFNRTNRKIESINYLFFNKKDIPYGISFLLSNGEEVNIEYSSENKYTFDALILN